MAKIFIIHGAFGSPSENWFPWLKHELELLGHEVYVPKFPTPDNQSLDNWRGVFKPYENKIDENTIFVGHSLGPAFIFDVIERVNVKIKAVFLISGFIGLLGNKTFDSINSSFVKREFDWCKIKQNCQHFLVYHSDNDPYVPIESANDLAEKLGSCVNLLKGAGHFNKDTGYDKFNNLLDDIKAIF